MRCLTCAHAKRPSTHRVSSIPPSQITFGDEVQLDCICIHDASKQQHWFLSIIDRATSYHLIELMRDHSPAELYRALTGDGASGQGLLSERQLILRVVFRVMSSGMQLARQVQV